MEYIKQYFVLPECCIAFNAKVASSSLACSIVRKYYPERYQQAVDDYNNTWSRYSQKFKDSLPESFQIMFKTDFENSKSFWQNICVRSRNPEKKVLLAVREPISRFTSTCAYMQKDAELVLQALENDTSMVLEKLDGNVRRNTHFLPQSIYMDVNCKAYKFPEQARQMCCDAKLDYPLPKINEGKHEKPILTEQQIERVKNYYKEDFDLYNSL
jgi:hypothetical protein